MPDDFVTNVAQQIEFIRTMKDDTQGLNNIDLELARTLPDHKSGFNRAVALYYELNKIGTDLINIEDEDPKIKSDEVRLKELSALSDRCLGAHVASLDLNRDVNKTANEVKEKRELHYKIAKYSSYVLFAIGWFLTFYGQITSEEDKTEIKGIA